MYLTLAEQCIFQEQQRENIPENWNIMNGEGRIFSGIFGGPTSKLAGFSG
jgi:hypothetical protein